MTTETEALPTFFISHGAGPCFFLDWGPTYPWVRMDAWLRSLSNEVGVTPKAIVVISGHWEERIVTVNTQRQPPLFFDYYGYPPETYQLTYPAPGSPELAQQIRELLADAGIPTATDDERGLDHGVFVPFKLIYPEAQIPIVQLSLRAGLDPSEHLAIGRALAPLRREGVLIVGSGASFHNRPAYNKEVASELFDGWLSDTLTAEPAERDRLLARWEAAPAARAAHAREEHLIPLMVAAGAAGADGGTKIFTDKIRGVTTSGFKFGG